MKIWFDMCHSWEEAPKVGIDWYKHHKNHSWKGFTLQFFFFKYVFEINYVNNYKKYKQKFKIK